MDADAALVAEEVRKAYGGTVALDGVSLSVDGGEVFGLVGPNGAGKTTLVRALTGTVAVDGGTVRLLGAPPARAASERVGLLPQAFRPHERLTARELLAYYRGLYDEGRAVEAVLDDVGLTGAAGTRYEALSGGQRRRVCVGTALVNDPDVLVLDEPTTGIDPAGRRALWSLFEDLAAAGTTILLTTHYMAEAERLADRVGLLSEGELVAVGSPDELVAAHGGPTRLVVETGAVPADLDGLPFSVEAGETGLVFPGLAPTDVGRAVEALEAAGVAYDSLTWREPDLGDVYLELAGEEAAAGTGAGGDESIEARLGPRGGAE